MIVRPTDLPGVLVVEPKTFADDRGYLREIWQRDRYADAGLPATFFQTNLSVSRRKVLRGLHFQEPRPQGKLVSAVFGAVWDVAVDIRVGSPTFGRWVAVELDAETGRQIYVPEGFAHGFVVLSDRAVVTYQCTAPYAPACEGSVRWDDPALGITWPVEDPQLSPKDAAAPLLADIPPDRLPRYAPRD